MPKVLRPTPRLPITVEIAASAFGVLEVRLALVDYYRRNPGSQRQACEALQLQQSAVSVHIAALVKDGVLISTQDPFDNRYRHYSVDLPRARQLMSALSNYVTGDIEHAEHNDPAPGGDPHDVHEPGEPGPATD